MKTFLEASSKIEMVRKEEALVVLVVLVVLEGWADLIMMISLVRDLEIVDSVHSHHQLSAVWVVVEVYPNQPAQ